MLTNQDLKYLNKFIKQETNKVIEYFQNHNFQDFENLDDDDFWDYVSERKQIIIDLFENYMEDTFIDLIQKKLIK